MSSRRAGRLKLVRQLQQIDGSRRKRTLVEYKANVVCGLFSAGAMVPYDLNQPIEHGCAHTDTSVGQHPLHILSIARMATS